MAGSLPERVVSYSPEDGKSIGIEVASLLRDTPDIGIAIERMITTFRNIPEIASVYFIPSYDEEISRLQVIGVWRDQVGLSRDAGSLRAFSTTVGGNLQPFEARVRSDSQIFDSRRWPFIPDDINGQFVHVVFSPDGNASQ